MRNQLKTFLQEKIQDYTQFYNDENKNPSLIDDTKTAYDIIQRNFDVANILTKVIDGEFIYDPDKVKLFEYVDDIINVEMFIYNYFDILNANIDNIAYHMELKQELIVRYGKPNPRSIR